MTLRRKRKHVGNVKDKHPRDNENGRTNLSGSCKRISWNAVVKDHPVTGQCVEGERIHRDHPELGEVRQRKNN